MTLTERDRKILMLGAPLVLVLVYWFLLLSPKREEASAASETLSAEQAKLDDAQSQASTLAAAKANFARDYAAVVRLGKAVPASVDMPSLLVQLEKASAGTGILFEKVTVGARIAAEGAAPVGAPPVTGAAPAPTAPSGEAPASAPGEAAAAAQGATDTANAANGAPPADPTAPADPAAGAAATSTAPPSPALESVPLDFSFKGSFFELADFFHELKRFVYVAGDRVRVRGRLMTIDAVQYTADPLTFPELSATVTATVYLTPKAEGIAAGATPSGPPPAPATSAPSTSTASGGGAAPPAPTATATP